MDRLRTADLAITIKLMFSNHWTSHTCGLGDTVKLIERGIAIRLAPKNAYGKNLARNIFTTGECRHSTVKHRILISFSLEAYRLP